MRKFIGVLLSVLCICCAAIGLTGCKKDKHIHAFDKQVITDEYKATDATCTEAATYYYSCECGEKGTETFTSGNALGHSFTNYVSDNNATCTEDGTKTAKCDRCNETDTVKDIDSKLHHSYTEQIVSDEYLAAPATCTEKATYYYSCKCGATGIETFEYGSTTDHNFVNGKCTYCGKEQEASKGLAFTLLDDGTYEVSGIGSCTDTEIVIPSVYNDKPVTVIGEHAFSGSGLTSVTIEKGVSHIGSYAFTSCVRLLSVTIPDSVETIAEGAFFYCLKLVEVINNSNLDIVKGNREYGDIGSYALNIKKCGTTDIVNKNNYLFYTSENVNYLLDYIGKDSDLTLPSDYNGQSYQIYDYAFAVRNELARIAIPDEVTSIGYAAFMGCSGVESIIVSAGNTAYSSINNCLIDTVNGTLIFGCKNSVIPNDRSITAIGDGAFNFCSDLTSIIIPDGVLSIGDYAFGGCGGLTSATIPDSVTSIGIYAFSGCYKLVEVINKSGLKITKGSNNNGDIAYYALNVKSGGTSDIVNKDGYLFYTYDNVNYLVAYVGSNTDLTLPDDYNGQNYELNNYAFYNCSGLTSVTIPDSVTSIGELAFSGCSGLTSVTIPDSVTSIGELAFSGCSGLTSITIPDSVTSIGDSAFEGCRGLTSVTIPDSVTSIGGGAFNSCSGLTSVIWNAENCTSVGSSSYPIFSDCLKLANVTIGENVKIIPNSAFSYCSGLTSVTIPNSVTSIGDRAFWYCSGLTSVTIGNGVTSIGEFAFYGCYKLVEVINKSGLNITKGSSNNGDIAYYALNVKKDGTSDIVNKEGYLFYTYDNVNYLLAYVGSNTDLTLPDDYNGQNYKLNNFAFYNCSGLTSVTIGNSVTSIGELAFGYCSGLTSVTIGNGVTSIGDSAFYGCSGLTSVTIGNGVTSIGGSAFYGCSGLKDVYMTDLTAWCNISGLNYLMSYNSIDKKLYLNNNLVTTLTIPDSVTTIGSGTFSGCSSLTSVTIGNGVTSIGDDAFLGCSELTSITIPDSVNVIGSNAFEGCNAIASIKIGSIESWCNIAGLENLMRYGTDDKKLYLNGKEITELIIPDSVTNIDAFAFYNCSGLISITIPDSVTSIGSNAFEGNVIASININSIESWCKIDGLSSLMRYRTDDKKLYLNGEEITELIIPDGVTNIAEFAFFSCSGLTSVTISDSVTSIGSCAFSCCLGLKNLIIPDGVISIGGQAFYHCENVETIEVSKNNTVYSAVNNCLIEKETKTLIFGCRNSIIPDDGSVTTIGVFAFDGCRGLTSIVIPNRVNKISMYAFNLCYDLLSVTIGSNVKTIETGAFANCFKLIEIINKCDIEITKGSTENGQVGYNAVVIKKDGESEIENVDGFLFYNYENINYLLGYTGNDAELILPDTYKGQSYEMNHDVFLYRYDLNSISIGNNVTDMSDYMFFGCGNLRSVIIGSNIKSIGEKAFAYCKSLTSIIYNGNIADWENITKGINWNYEVPTDCIIHCTDGDIKLFK